MNNKKIDALLNQLGEAVQIQTEEENCDVPQFVEFSTVEDVCGKPNNIVLCLACPVDLGVTEDFYFTEQNINDATVSSPYELTIRDTTNKTHKVTVYIARQWKITTKW